MDVSQEVKTGKLFMVDLAGSERAAQTKVRVPSQYFCVSLSISYQLAILVHFPMCVSVFRIKENGCWKVRILIDLSWLLGTASMHWEDLQKCSM